jgi:site-specific DNA recombinase
VYPRHAVPTGCDTPRTADAGHPLGAVATTAASRAIIPPSCHSGISNDVCEGEATARRARARTVAAAAETGLRVAIYVRRSTDEEHQPFSIEAQDSRLRSYVKSQPGWSLVARFEDDASGAKLDRPGLEKALAAARAGRFDVLLVYRVDRFTRRISDLVNVLDELDRAGVSFRSATEPFDTSTPAGRMLVQMLGVFAEFEREMIIDRVINGMERKASKGRWTLSRVPYGSTAQRTTR